LYIVGKNNILGENIETIDDENRNVFLGGWSHHEDAKIVRETANRLNMGIEDFFRRSILLP